MAGSPWSGRTRNAYSELEQDVNIEPTWSSAVSLSLSTTPSAVMLRTWLMPTHGEGKVTVTAGEYDFL